MILVSHDTEFVTELEPDRVLVMPDHPTPCALKTHTADPVPFLVYVAADEQKPRALSRGYNERDARDQGIFIPDGHTLLERLLRR